MHSNNIYKKTKISNKNRVQIWFIYFENNIVRHILKNKYLTYWRYTKQSSLFDSKTRER